jgi:hypothetical protein
MTTVQVTIDAPVMSLQAPRVAPAFFDAAVPRPLLGGFFVDGDGTSRVVIARVKAAFGPFVI